MNFKPALLLLFFSSILINAQDIPYAYLPDNVDSLKVYLKQINSNHIDRIDGDFSAKIKKIFKGRDEVVFKSFEDSTYIFNSKIDNYIGEIANNIYSSNPEIESKDFKFFLKNSIVPNAACYGDGMFEINVGLLTRLEVDDELAFIMCHEIAHRVLDHALNNVSRKVVLINSKDMKEKLRDIKRQEYGQTRAALSVIDGLKIDMLDYSKEVEAQADSMGFLLFANTKYGKYNSVSSLEKLKRVDEMVFHHDIKLDSVFNLKTYPFKKYWLKEPTSLFDTDEEIDEFSLISDTLKTHPELEYRIEKLISNFSLDVSQASNITEPSYALIRQEADKQSVHSAFDLNLLDLALYELIEKKNRAKISDDFYYSQMAQVLQSVYKAKKNHELGKYVPHTNSFSNEKRLNAIRLFLHNLELMELKKMGLAFCEENKLKVSNNHKFDTSFDFFKTINN